MLDLQTISTAVREVVHGLTNIVGLIEKNVESYNRLNDRHREHRLKEGLEKILIKLTRWRGDNDMTLWELGQFVAEEAIQPVPPESNLLLGDWAEDDDSILHSHAYVFAAFLEDILDTAVLLENYHKDIIRFDRKLYEELQYGILMRRRTLGALLGMDDTKFDPRKLEEIYKIYKSLVTSTSECKDRLQAVLDKRAPQATSKPSSKPKSDKAPKARGRRSTKDAVQNS